MNTFKSSNTLNRLHSKDVRILADLNLEDQDEVTRKKSRSTKKREHIMDKGLKKDTPC